MLRRFYAPLTAAALLIIPVSGFAQTAAWRLPSSTVLSRTADEAQAPYYDARRTAYDQGYREGADDGQQDARRGDRFNYRDERAFQRADRGYNRSYGDRERYRQIFRDGYAVGYREAFGRFSRNGRNDGWSYPGVTQRALSVGSGPTAAAIGRRRLLHAGVRQRCARWLREGPGGRAEAPQLRSAPAFVVPVRRPALRESLRSRASSTRTSIAGDSSRATSADSVREPLTTR